MFPSRTMRLFFLIGLTAALWLLIPPPAAATYMPLDGAGIRIEKSRLPTWVFSETFSMAAWFWTDDETVVNQVGIEGLLVLAGSNTTNTARVISDGDGAAFDAVDVTVETGGAGQWRLLLASWNPQEHRLKLVVVSKEHPDGVMDVTTSSGFTAGPGRNLHLGIDLDAQWNGQSVSLPGARGASGPVCIRRGVEASLEVAAEMYASRDIMAPIVYSGHGYEGMNDDMLAFNYGMVTSPRGYGITPVVGASYGKPMVPGNILIMSSTNSTASHSTRLLSVRPVVVFGQPTFQDHRLLDPGFFQQRPAGVTTDGTVGNSPIAAALGSLNPTRHYKIGAWSNSRGMRTQGGYVPSDPSLYWLALPGSHANGYIAELMERAPHLCNGVVCAPLGISASSPDNRRRWVFDGVGGAYTQGEVSGSNGDFGRFWTGNNHSMIPGAVVTMGPESIYCFKARDMPLSATTRDRPLRITMDYLCYPGSPDGFSWLHVEALAQSQAGSAVGPSGSVDGCNTEQARRTFDHAMDWYDEQAAKLQMTDLPEGIRPGWAVFISKGPGAGSIAEVRSVKRSIYGQIVALRHGFGEAPGEGSVLHFGPWHYGSAQYTAPPTALLYRGPRIHTGPSDYRGPMVLLSYSAWAVDEHDVPLPGFAFAAMGTGGAGYRLQAERGVDNLPGKIARHLDLDAVFLHNATQGTMPEDMTDFANAIEASSNAQAVLCSDMVHDYSYSINPWADYILSQDRHAGSVVTEAAGAYDQHIAHGEKHDKPHPSLLGMKALAGHHMDMFAEHFGSGVPGDLNNDGLVNVADLLVMLAAWGQCAKAQPCPADLNGDGVVNLGDLMLLFANWNVADFGPPIRQ